MTKRPRPKHLKDYGLSAEDWEILIQDNFCPLCRRGYTGLNPACVDHDHRSGVIDGIICRACNYWLGGRARKWQFYQRVADYLREPPAKALPGPRRKHRDAPPET